MDRCLRHRIWLRPLITIRPWGGCVRRTRTSRQGSRCGWRSVRSNLFRPRAADRPAGLDVSGLDGVISVDPAARTADVQGMCTYEDLVDATLPHGLMPMVVPQLKTITLGGAVTGLGIESSSFRNGLPHESVLEMDILTGDGEIVTARPDGEHAELFRAFPNSYGSLGYAIRLRIELDRSRRTSPSAMSGSRPRRADSGDRGDRASGMRRGRAGRLRRRRRVQPDEAYLTLGRNSDAAAEDERLHRPADLLPVAAQRQQDVLTAHDYLWRWDTDWFWCSGAFGAQKPRRPPAVAATLAAQRRLPPDRRAREPHRLAARGSTAAAASPTANASSRTSRSRSTRLADFLRWFAADVGMRPVWLCPLRLREPDGRVGALAAVPARARPRRTSTSASGAPSRSLRAPPTATSTERSRRPSPSTTGTSRCTPTPTTTETTFDRLYGGPGPDRGEETLRPRCTG